MNLRQLKQQIHDQQREIDRLSIESEALDKAAEAMQPTDRAKARQAAERFREKLRSAILRLHKLQDQLPNQTPAEADWVGSFAFEEHPVKLPAEMAHLWAGTLDHPIAA